MNYRPERLNAEEIWDSIDVAMTATEIIAYTTKYVLNYLKNLPTTIKSEEGWYIFIPS